MKGVSIAANVYQNAFMTRIVRNEEKWVHKFLDGACKMDYTIREIRIDEIPLLDEFLYEAIFVPAGELKPDKI